jgi:hypothetical protein
VTFVDPGRPSDVQVPGVFGEDVAALHGIMLRALERCALLLQGFEGRDMRCVPMRQVYQPIENDLRLALEAIRPITTERMG